MLIQVLGTGCAKCTKLAELAEEAAKNAGVDYTLEKVTSISKILDMGVMTTNACLCPAGDADSIGDVVER